MTANPTLSRSWSALIIASLVITLVLAVVIYFQNTEIVKMQRAIIAIQQNEKAAAAIIYDHNIALLNINNNTRDQAAFNSLIQQWANTVETRLAAP